MPRTAQQYADELLADNLAAGRTVVEAARAAGVSERTAYRRMKEPAVRARITEVRRAALDAVAGRLTHGMVAACDHLTELIGHDNPHVQIRAAKTVLQLALQVHRAVDAEDRSDQQGDPTRLPPVVPAVAAIGPGPVALELGEGPAERSDQPGRDGNVDSPVEGEMPPGAHASAIRGGNEVNTCGESTPAPDSSGQTIRALSRDPETGTRRSGRMVSLVGVVLVLATGLSFAATGEACTHTEPVTDRRAQTCQNLPEPANRLTFTPTPEGFGGWPAESTSEQARARTVGRHLVAIKTSNNRRQQAVPTAPAPFPRPSCPAPRVTASRSPPRPRSRLPGAIGRRSPRRPGGRGWSG